jgi:RNA polymerase sigma-70 factor (ECF subfamily)
VSERAGPAPPGWDAAERAARESYGRLVALLAWRWRDLAAAEDALADAFAAALAHWPREGVPASPEAWLLTAARRRLLEAARHRRVVDDPAVAALFDPDPIAPEAPAIPDHRLKLMFVCAHPALAENVHAPLMLQAVLGLDAATIAAAFLVSPAALAQRLVRAKAKIRATGMRFEEPEAADLPDRLGAVLESIYGAYTIGAAATLPEPDAGPAATSIADLRAEALYLGRLVAALQPASAEAAGLLALMLYCEARRPARVDADGRFVPLAQQDPRRWDAAALAQAEHSLRRASAIGEPGVFQLEAAIQSAHCQRAFGGPTPWGAIAELYAALVALAPRIGARIGQAVAQAEAGDLPAGLASLAALPEDAIRAHQPYWVALAHLRRLAGQAEAAAQALRRAIALTEDPRVRDYLARQLA